VRHPIILLPLHAPVLKPDLDLSFGETQLVSDLDASPARQVAVEVELLLELKRLMTGVGGACSLAISTVHAVNTFTTNAQTFHSLMHQILSSLLGNPGLTTRWSLAVHSTLRFIQVKGAA